MQTYIDILKMFFKKKKGKKRLRLRIDDT